MQFFFAQEAIPCRHLVVSPTGNRRDDVFFAAAPQPSIVSQVRRHAYCALAFVAVARNTVRGEEFFTARRTGLVKLLAAGQRHHEMRRVFHAFLAQNRTPGRHVAHTAFGNGFVDFFRRAAVNPVGIDQIRETARTFGIRTVALDTVSTEQVFTNLHCRRVFGHILNAHIFVFGIQSAGFFLCSLHFILILTHAAPRFAVKANAFEVAQTGIQYQIAHCGHNSGNEHPEPPARHPVVILFDTVPRVAGRFHFLFARRRLEML